MNKYLLTIGTILMLIIAFCGCVDDTDGEGNGDSSSQVGNQSPMASCSANPMSGTEPLTVYFIGSGSDTDGYIVSYYWNFGDGETSSSKSPSHTYQNSGVYTARLTVTDDDGATDSDSITITVEEEPKITKVEILQHKAYYKTPALNPQNDGVNVIGVLKNTGDTNVQVKVTANFYNEHDYLVYSKEGYGTPYYITSDEKSFFDIFVFGDLDYSYYTLEFTGTEHYRSDYTDFSSYIHSAGTVYYPYTNDNYCYHINGTLYNTGSGTAYYVNIKCVLYDEFGNLIGYGYDFLHNTGSLTTRDENFFPPGESKSFSTITHPDEIIGGDFSRIASYEIIAATPYGDYD